MCWSTSLLKPFWITCLGCSKLGNGSSWSILKLLSPVTVLLRKGPYVQTVFAILLCAGCFT